MDPWPDKPGQGPKTLQRSIAFMWGMPWDSIDEGVDEVWVTHTHKHTQCPCQFQSLPLPCATSYLLHLTNKDKHALQGCLPTGKWVLNAFFFYLSLCHTHIHALQGQSPLGNLWLNSPPALSLSLTPLPCPYNDLPRCIGQTHAHTRTDSTHTISLQIPTLGL